MKSDGFFKKCGVCALSAALCVSAFASCGKDDGKGDKIDGNTDITAVKSEQVKDEAAWKAAFDVTKFTNYTMKEEDKRTQAGVTTEGRIVYKFSGDKAYYSTYQKKSADENEQHDIYFAKTNEVWAAYGINYKNGAKITESAYDMENHSEYEYIISGAMGVTPVSQLAQTVTFDKVTYDETAKGYLYEVEGQGTATIKIADGLFAGYIMKSESGEGDKKVVAEMKVSYYDVGSTSVSLPEKMGKPAEDTKDEGKKDDEKKDDEKKDDEKKPGVVLTANTDFGALESEKVDAAGWAKAFNPASYSNFTAYAYYNSINSYMVQKAATTMGFFGMVGDNAEDVYCFEGEDGKYMGMSGGQVSEWPEGYYMRDGMPVLLNYSCLCPNFAKFFAEFTYDETKKSYVYAGEGIRTNDYFLTGGISAHYVKVELKIVNGLVAYVSVEDKDGNKENTKFYDFGTTVVKLPEIAK